MFSQNETEYEFNKQQLLRFVNEFILTNNLFKLAESIRIIYKIAENEGIKRSDINKM